MLAKKSVKNLEMTEAMHDSVLNMTNTTIQYVGFRTELPVAAFRVVWTPIALAFKTRGITAIDLYQLAQETQVTFMSRNVWEPDQYLRVFPSGVADAAAFGSVEVVQFGGYADSEADTRDARAVETLSVLFTPTRPSGREDTHVLGRVTDSVPYLFASEMSKDASTRAMALGEVLLVGRHVCRL